MSLINKNYLTRSYVTIFIKGVVIVGSLKTRKGHQ